MLRPYTPVVLAAVLAAALVAGCSSSGGRHPSASALPSGGPTSEVVSGRVLPPPSLTSPITASSTHGRSRTVGPAGGPSSPVAAGGKVTDACTLLPRSEAQTIVKKTITRVQRQPAGPFVSCGYYGRDLGPLVQIQVNANPYTRAQFESTAKAESGVAGDATPLRGIGDAAYGYRDAPGYVVVLAGSTFFQIVAGGTGADAATARTVAERVAARL